MAGRLTARALRAAPVVSPRRLSWPVAAPVISPYGLRGARFHGGIDIVAALGTPVGSPGGGEVVWAGWRPGGWGNAVMVAHGDGVRSLVAHLSRVDVHVGDRVHGPAIGSGSRAAPATRPGHTSTSRCASAGRTSTR